MRRALNLIRTAVLSAATAAALGFSAQQALAGPEQAEFARTQLHHRSGARGG